MIIYDMIREKQKRAQVVTLDSGKCVVSWPTSVVIYDTEDAARAVHVEHMGGRGEPTRFDLSFTDDKEGFQRGWNDAAQDDCEGCPFASIGGLEARESPTAPKYIAAADAARYLHGHRAFAQARYGADWRTCTFGFGPALVIQ